MAGEDKAKEKFYEWLDEYFESRIPSKKKPPKKPDDEGGSGDHPFVTWLKGLAD